ncbi:MAG TPA: kanamycin nucleotidyltransferase C-terminal domain-containing protein [Candidatus Bathyarchaeia archaeon]|jgi:kanamycin nucleotidyltransferase|nr:kanamycin nucleotidyltransferase C-terminal domain-containing protein [Candidatus Bathyarchaeia archaeon]
MRKVESGSLRLRVPLRRVAHRERVELARNIASRIVKTYKDVVLAVCIDGSTAKKLDRPYSDLEMFCVVTDGQEIPGKFYLYDGLLVQIEYFQESKFLKEAERVGFDWHLAADEFRNRIVLFERDEWLKRLDKAVEGNNRADFSEDLRWATLAMTESLAAVRNARLKNDWRDTKTRAFYLAWDVSRVVFLYNRKYVLTTSWFWKLLFECEEQPKNLQDLIDILAGFKERTGGEIADAAEELWRETMKMVQSRRFAINASDIIV